MKAANATQKADLTLIPFVIVDLTGHPEANVVGKGVLDSLYVLAVNLFPTLEDEGGPSVVDSGGINPCKGMEGSDGTKIAFGSG
jgi:hypothetical protein